MTSTKKQTGFTLLEVILALAILAGALTVLGELARRSLHNAEVSRATSEAQLLCESKLAEMAAGVTPVSPVEDATWQSYVVFPRNQHLQRALGTDRLKGSCVSIRDYLEAPVFQIYIQGHDRIDGVVDLFTYRPVSYTHLTLPTN